MFHDQDYEDLIPELKKTGRQIGPAGPSDADKLGPLAELPGTWSNKAEVGGIPFEGFGWNLTALPLSTAPFKYRVLMNQYNEQLNFSTADLGVPNRGLDPADGADETSGDQFVAALDYEQLIRQIAADDAPSTSPDIVGGPDKGIHHEPGLFLHILNKRTEDLSVARLGTIPHGDSLLAMGRATPSEGTPSFPDASALPIGIPPGANFETAPPEGVPDYLAPYRHFIETPFVGTVEVPGFPGFLPQDGSGLLRLNPIVTGGMITQSTVLDFDTALPVAGDPTGGIVNIPFIVREANATQMRSVFWIHELNAEGPDGGPAMALQYLQIVMLEFFERRDGEPGLIKWPHISINTMLRTSREPQPMAM